MSYEIVRSIRRVADEHEHPRVLGHAVRSMSEIARDKKIYALMLLGRTTKELAQEFKVSEAKVVSILDEYSNDPDMQALSNKIQMAAFEARHPKTASVEEQSVVAHKPGGKVTNEQMLTALRMAMKDHPSGEAISEPEYNQWRKQKCPGAPGTRTIRRRFGWVNAKNTALGKHEFEDSRNDFWQKAFSFMRADQIPTLARTDSDLPSLEEWDGRSEDYRPLVKVATFEYPAGTSFDTFAKTATLLRGALNVRTCAVVPVGIIDSAGDELHGTVGTEGFRVWFSDEESIDPLDPSLNGWMRDLAVHARIMPRLEDVKGIGRCTLYSCLMVTKSYSKEQILEVKLVPPAGVNITTFINSAQAIQDALGVPWARFDKGSDSTIVMYMGGDPELDAPAMAYLAPASLIKRKIAKINWLYSYMVNDVPNDGEFPELLGTSG